MRAMVAIAAALLAPPAALAQVTIQTPGTVDHRAAGTGFAERVGEFRRASATRYDRDGLNLSAAYNLVRPGGRLLISVYLYPAPGPDPAAGAKDEPETARAALCARDFEGARQAVALHNKGARLVDSGAAAALPGADPRLSHRSVYEHQAMFDERLQEVRSEVRLYCYVGGDWQVKYRITATPGLDIEAAVEAFIRAGPWPGRAPPPPLEETVALPAASAPAP